MNIEERKEVVSTLHRLLCVYELQIQELLTQMEKEYIEEDFFEDLYEILYEFVYDEKRMLARTLKLFEVSVAKNTHKIE